MGSAVWKVLLLAEVHNEGQLPVLQPGLTSCYLFPVCRWNVIKQPAFCFHYSSLTCYYVFAGPDGLHPFETVSLNKPLCPLSYLWSWYFLTAMEKLLMQPRDKSILWLWTLTRTSLWRLSIVLSLYFVWTKLFFFFKVYIHTQSYVLYTDVFKRKSPLYK